MFLYKKNIVYIPLDMVVGHNDSCDLDDDKASFSLVNLVCWNSLQLLMLLIIQLDCYLYLSLKSGCFYLESSLFQPV